MRKVARTLILLFSLSLYSVMAYSQDSTTAAIQQLPDKYLDKTSARVTEIEKKLTRKTEKSLRKLQKEEDRLRKKLSKIDSTAANNLFSQSSAKYTALTQKLSQKAESISQRRIGNYIPYLDTLKTSLKFLNTSQLGINGSGELQNKLKEAMSKVDQLEGRFDQLASIQQILRERRQYLKEQLKKFGLDKYLKKMSKEVYYVSQTIKEYKEILSDPRKIEKHAIAALNKIPAFRKFVEKNSMLASVFGIPGAGNALPVSLVGVQTRASVQQLIQNSGLANVPNSQQFIQQQMQTANSQLEAMRDKIAFVDLSGNPEPMPDFKTNSQHGRSFLKRLEYKADVQFGKVNRLLPTTGDFSLSVGYKLNDKGVLGVGSSFKLGLGSGIRNIRFSTQGYGLRSYIDWQVRKTDIYVSGGYEANYLSQLRDSSLPAQVNVWQKSGLIGATKKYSMGKKKKGYVQLLFDFLSYQNIPRSQPIIFRTGINF